MLRRLRATVGNIGQNARAAGRARNASRASRRAASPAGGRSSDT